MAEPGGAANRGGTAGTDRYDIRPLTWNHHEPRETSERLLAAALRLFAETGYHATTIRDITFLAEANLGAVTYHFQSKERLYAQVLSSVLGPLRLRIAQVSQMQAQPLGRIEAAIRALFEHIRVNPEMPALMVRELASGQEPHTVILSTFGEMLPLLVGMIKAGQQDGSIRDGDPVLLALSTIAQPVYLNLARPVITRVIGLDPRSPEMAGRLVEHVVTTVLLQLGSRKP